MTSNNKTVDYIISKLLSFVIELCAVLFVTWIAISEIREVSQQAKAMLTSVQQFAGDRKEKVGDSIDNLSEQIKKFKLKYGKQDDR